MNNLMIIGNLTNDPEGRTTGSGKKVVTFTVAVNRKLADGHEQADFFRVSAWEKLGENCQRYLMKGRKVCVTGPVSASAYKGRDGEAKANLEVMAREVEFLSPREEGAPVQKKEEKKPEPVYMEVPDDDGLPF